MFKSFVLFSCIVLLFQPGHATRPLNPQAFDPQKCMQSVTKAAVCLTDFWTNMGRPSAACCKALEEMDDTCLPKLFPTAPFLAPFLKSLCSAAGGGTGGGIPGFPFPIPFPPIGGGAGGLPFPFPLPTPGVGSGASAPPPKA